MSPAFASAGAGRMTIAARRPFAGLPQRGVSWAPDRSFTPSFGCCGSRGPTGATAFSSAAGTDRMGRAIAGAVEAASTPFAALTRRMSNDCMVDPWDERLWFMGLPVILHGHGGERGFLVEQRFFASSGESSDPFTTPGDAAQ